MLNVIYLPSTGRMLPKCARASGFLEKTTLSVKTNAKALAEMVADRYMYLANDSFNSLWKYQSTVNIDTRRYHHFMKSTDACKHEYVWFAVELERYGEVEA